MGTESHYIAGKWIEGVGEPFFSFDPATLQPQWSGKEATGQEVLLACQSAREALHDWSSMDFEKRVEILRRFEAVLKEQKEPLTQKISQESGKPLWEAGTEVNATVGKIAISIEAFKNRCQTKTTELEQATLMTSHKPHGVCAVFGPFNFPAHLPNGHIVPALLAGNTIVFKCSKLAPSVGEALVRCWEQSGLPPGVLNLVQGGDATGSALAKCPEIDGLFFTGSYRVGAILQREFSTKPGKILALEMGGNNPIVIDDPDDLEMAAYNTILSAYITSGQRCSCARRLILVASKKSHEFLKVLVHMARALHVGPHTDHPEPFMGPLISERAKEHVLQTQKNLLRQKGVALLEMQSDALFVSPGLIDVTSLSKREDEECFGPLLQVITVPTFEAALTEANNTEYGLSAGFIGQDENKWKAFTQKVRAGVMNWNLPLTGASSHAPFGGVGKSGNFRPSAYYATDYCAYPVASMQSPHLKLPKALLPGVQLLART